MGEKDAGVARVFQSTSAFAGMIGSDIRIELENTRKDGRAVCSIHLHYVGEQPFSAHMLLAQDAAPMSSEEFRAYAEDLVRERQDELREFVEGS